MNTKAKGNAAERRAVKALEERGWLVYRAMAGGRRFMEKDIYGCIDLVAKKEGEPTLWVQVTAAKAFTHKFTEMVAVPWGPGDQVELWAWKGGRGGHFEVVPIHPPAGHQEKGLAVGSDSSNRLYRDTTSPSIPKGKETA